MLLTPTHSKNILNQIFGNALNVTICSHASCYLGVFTSDPFDPSYDDDTPGSTRFVEPPSSKNYERIHIGGTYHPAQYDPDTHAQVSPEYITASEYMSTSFGSDPGQVPDLSDFVYPSDLAKVRRIGNKKDINYNCAYLVSDVTAQTGGEWGTIYAFGLFPSATLTDHAPYAWGRLLTPVTVGHKNTLHFLKGRLVVYMDDEGNVTLSAQANV